MESDTNSYANLLAKLIAEARKRALQPLGQQASRGASRYGDPPQPVRGVGGGGEAMDLGGGGAGAGGLGRASSALSDLGSMTGMWQPWEKSGKIAGLARAILGTGG